MRLRISVSVLAAILAGAAAGTAGASPTFAQADTGRLVGTVHDTQGVVVRDTTIVVYPPDPAGVEVARTTTDVAGRFGVPALAPGSYQILIAGQQWYEWAPGQITDRAKAPAYRVLAGGTTVASSVVTAPGRIAGRVTTAAGRPASGIWVAVVDMTTAGERDTTTASDGTYSVTLSPGTEYYVSFINGKLTQYSRQALEWTHAQRYTVKSGHTTRVNEQLLPPATLSGRLVDESGTPVAGAQVNLAILDTAGEVSTSTDAHGRYTFTKLPPGPVTVEFTAPDGRRQWAYQKTSSAEADRFTLALGTVTTVNETLLPYRPPGRIAGRVTTAAGEPASGIQVSVVDMNTAWQWDTTTASDGTYSVTLSPGTEYYVRFTNGNLSQYSRQALEWAHAQRYTVSSGLTTVVDEQLLPPATLSGRLVDESGTPVAGAQVNLAILDTAGTASTSTDADGRYTFTRMAPGTVTVEFTAPDGRTQWAHQRTSYAEADRFTLTLGTVTTVDETLLPVTAPAR